MNDYFIGLNTNGRCKFMQIPSLTVGGAHVKAEIQQLPLYTKQCCIYKHFIRHHKEARC